MRFRSAAIAIALAPLAIGCPSPEPTPPVFPADYAATYTEVRDCRRSPDHDLDYIRVLASPDALAVYTARVGDFPEGAVLVKEQYADPDCTDLVGWSAMERAAGDWRWQSVAADRTVMEDGAVARCAGCHASCGVPPDGYQGTCALP